MSIQMRRATVAPEVQQLMGVTRRLPAIGAPSTTIASALGKGHSPQGLEGLQLGSRKLAMALRLKTMLLIDLVFLMSVHPDRPASLVSIAACLLVGLLWFFVDGERLPNFRGRQPA